MPERTYDGPEFLLHSEVAALLRMTEGALYQHRQRGTAPPAIQRGRKLLYRRSDVIEWLEAQAESAPGVSCAPLSPGTGMTQ